MKSIASRRKVLGCLVAGCIVPIFSARSAGALAAANRPTANLSPTTFLITSPAQNSNKSATFTVSGTAGSQWVNVAIYSASTKVGPDVTPSGGAWSTTVNMGSLTGAQTLTVMAFSVPPGQAGGTSATATLNVTIGLALAPNFYGMNSHFDTQLPATNGSAVSTIAATIAIMKSLRTKVLRLAWEGTALNGFGQTSLQSLTQYAQAFQTDGSGLQLYACANLSMESAPGVAYASEAAAYGASYTIGAQIASALLPYAANVTAIECGNEMDSHSAGGVAIRISQASGGSSPADFSQKVWPLFRGATGGCMAGVRSVTTTIPCASNAFTVSSIAASDMLWNGTNPNGTTGSATVRWNITAWHLYATEGTSMGMDGGSPTFNLFTHLASYNNNPVVLSEWSPGNTNPAANAPLVTKYLTDWFPNRQALNLVSVIFYSLFDQNFQCMVNGNAPPYLPNAAGTALQNFSAAHPA